MLCHVSLIAGVQDDCTWGVSQPHYHAVFRKPSALALLQSSAARTDLQVVMSADAHRWGNTLDFLLCGVDGWSSAVLLWVGTCLCWYRRQIYGKLKLYEEEVGKRLGTGYMQCAMA